MDTAVHHMSPPLVGNHTPLPSMVRVSISDPGGVAVARVEASETEGPMLDETTEVEGEAELAVLRATSDCRDGEKVVEVREGETARPGEAVCCWRRALARLASLT